MSLADMHRRGSGYPIGGSLNLAKMLEKSYLDLGGKIHYFSKVKKITFSHESGKAKATGVELEDGNIFLSDLVISAADGHDTLFRMLEGRFMVDKLKEYYERAPVFSSYLQVSLGINRTFANIPSSVYFQLDKPIKIDPETEKDTVGFRIFNFDPTLAPAGKTAVVSMIDTYNHEYWIKLRKDDPTTYKAEKHRIADAVIEVLEKRIGNVKNYIETVDVSSPATVVRYTNNWKGSFEGWIMTPKIAFELFKSSLPGLQDFYMIGQWMSPGGGLPSGLLTGRNVAQLICARDKKQFTTRQF
jgi:phytoene dehydrogenase-like protein